MTAAGSTSNFSAAYPTEAFDFSLKHWVQLLEWDSGVNDAKYPRQALLVLEAYVSWGDSVVSPLTLDADGMTVRLTTFSDDLSNNFDDDRFEASTVVAAGGLAAAKLSPKSATEVAILNGGTGSTDRNKLALQIENTGASPFAAGPLKLTVVVREV